MKLQIEITEKDLRAMVLERIQKDLGDAGSKLDESDVTIEVKSKQNWKSEWERAEFRARVEVDQ